MDKEEANKILENELVKLKAFSFDELKKIISNSTCHEVDSPSGTKYQIETIAVWDSKEDGDLRVMVSIDDGEFITSMFPVSMDFLISAEGVIR